MEAGQFGKRGPDELGLSHRSSPGRFAPRVILRRSVNVALSIGLPRAGHIFLPLQPPFIGLVEAYVPTPSLVSFSLRFRAASTTAAWRYFRGSSLRR
jgi:hypothetical protein